MCVCLFSVLKMLCSDSDVAFFCPLQNRDSGGEAADELDVHLPLRLPQGQSHTVLHFSFNHDETMKVSKYIKFPTVRPWGGMHTRINSSQDQLLIRLDQIRRRGTANPHLSGEKERDNKAYVPHQHHTTHSSLH